VGGEEVEPPGFVFETDTVAKALLPSLATALSCTVELPAASASVTEVE
jgi:hypothetical protein